MAMLFAGPRRAAFTLGLSFVTGAIASQTGDPIGPSLCLVAIALWLFAEWFED